MKLGLITWFANENYGTCLQAVASSIFLKSNGYYPVLLNFTADDFNNSNETINKSKSKVKKVFLKIINYIKKALFYKSLSIRSIKFAECLKEFCSFTDIITDENEYCECCNKFDLLIYGSDQIWNPVNYHPIWFGNYDSIRIPKISYAPSLGCGTIPQNLKENYIDSLKNFSAISLREKKSAELLENLLNKNIPTVLDPTFLLSSAKWLELSGFSEFNCKKPYVLCYFLSDNLNHYIAAFRFALSNHLRIIIIPYRLKSYAFLLNTVSGVGPNDFINLVNNAEYVLTDSYHGTIFSIIFQKQFYTFERFKKTSENNQNERIYDILQRFGLTERLVINGAKKTRTANYINYTYLQPIIKKEIESSGHFLIDTIERNKKV